VLLRKPRIEAAIEAHFAKADITIARVLEELRRIAFSDLREVAEWGGEDGVKLLRSDTLSDEAASAIAEVVDHTKVRVEPGGGDKAAAHEILDRQVRVKLHDKLAALPTASPAPPPRVRSGPRRPAACGLRGLRRGCPPIIDLLLPVPRHQATMTLKVCAGGAP
jgi:hypothetical protein